MKFWLENWIYDNKPLMFHAMRMIPSNMIECNVADFVSSDGN